MCDTLKSSILSDLLNKGHSSKTAAASSVLDRDDERLKPVLYLTAQTASHGKNSKRDVFFRCRFCYTRKKKTRSPNWSKISKDIERITYSAIQLQEYIYVWEPHFVIYGYD